MVYGTSWKIAGYDASTGDLKYKLSGLPRLVFAPDGRYFAMGDWRKPAAVSCWDADTGKQLFESEKQGGVTTMAFGPDAETLSVGWEDGQVDRFGTNDGALVDSLQTTASPKCILPTGDRYIGFVRRSGPLGQLVLADSTDGRRVATLSESAHVLSKATCTPDGNFLTIVEKGMIRVFRRYSASDAEAALDRLDPRAKDRWYRALAEVYGGGQ